MNSGDATGSGEESDFEGAESLSDGSSDDVDDTDDEGDGYEDSQYSVRKNGKTAKCSESENETHTENDITLLGTITSNKAGKSAAVVKEKVKKEPKKKLSPEEKLKAQEEENVNRIRKKLRLSVNGDGVPAPIESFDDLRTRFGVSSNLVNNLTKLGYAEPTPIQTQAWPIMLKVCYVSLQISIVLIKYYLLKTIYFRIVKF